MKKTIFLLIFAAAFPFFSLDAFAAAEKALHLRNKGYQLQIEGDMEGAAKYYKLAIKEDGKYAAVHNDLGVAYETNNNFKAAEKEYLKALKIDPNNPSANSNLAALYERKGDIDKAILYWKKRAQQGKEDDPWRKRALENLAAYGVEEASEKPKSETESPEERAKRIVKEYALEKKAATASPQGAPHSPKGAAKDAKK